MSAETLAKGQREISVSEFFVKNRHLLGFDNPSKALLTTIKEAVDNSLDACEEAGLLPELHIEVHDLALEAKPKDAELTKGEGRFLVVVQDNGPGIVKAQVPKIFGKLLYGSKFHRYKQARGQQGIGISAAAMYGQLTTGKPIRVTSRIGKNKAAHVFDIQLDTRKNEPVVTHDEMLAQWHQEHGTRVELEIVANWQQGQRFVNRYVEHTALANPHATIHYTRPVGSAQRAGTDKPGNETLTFPRATTELPKEALEIKPHPHGVELGALMLMARESKSRDVRGFLQTAFSRVSPSAAGDILAKVPWGKKPVKPRVLGENRAMAEDLHKAIAATRLMSPPTNCLSPIGDELMRKGLVSFLSVIESEGDSGDENAQLDLDAAAMKPGKKAAKARGEGGQGSSAARAGAGPRCPARRGRREDQGPQLFHRDGDATAEGVSRQPVPGGGRPRLRRELARGQDDRALPLRKPRPAPVPARGLRYHRGHRAHGLAQLPAQPAQGLAARGTDGPPRPHRVGLGPVHQRVEGGRRPLPGHPEGDPARGPGMRPQAGHLHPQAQGPRLPGPAPQHLRALHRGGRHRHRQDHGPQARAHQEGVPAGGAQGHGGGDGRGREGGGDRGR